MDRPEQDNSGKFEGGIFSSMITEENEPELDADVFFDYASPGWNGRKQGEHSPQYGPAEARPMLTEEEPAPAVGERLLVTGEGASAVEEPTPVTNGPALSADIAVPTADEAERAADTSTSADERRLRQDDRSEDVKMVLPKQGAADGQGRGIQFRGVQPETYRRDGQAAWQNQNVRQGSGMPPYHNGDAWDPYQCRYCPNNRKKEHPALIAVLVAAIAALLIAFLATLFCLVKVSSLQFARVAENSREEERYRGENPSNGGLNGRNQEIPMPNAGDYYGEVADAIRTDLDYSIEWENYEYEGNSDQVTIAVDYPVIRGSMPNRSVINEIIKEETEYFEEYYKEYSKYMMPEENFLVYSEGYVTYMDPEVMSVVFAEMIYTDYWTDYSLYCLNIDVENGIVLDNNSIMQIDDEFAVDFRTRCRQQNGTVYDLEYMSDQEIAQYLSSGGTAIIFYTPLGMEVGMNMGEYYVTVTYRDYEKYLQRY